MKAFSGTFFKKICFHGFLFFGIWLFWGISSQVQAANSSSGLTYTGRILDAKETPVTASSVIFTVTVYDSSGKCWLYTEQRNLDLSQTAGTFSFEIGSSDASTLYGAAPSFNNQSSGGPKDLAELFSNRRAYTGLGNANGCTGSYDPSTATDPNEGRLLSVYFRIGASGTDQAIPPMRVTPVPMAMQALSVNGYGTGELLRVDQSIVTSTGIANNALSVAQYTEFWSLMNKASTSYLPVTGDVGISGGNNKITSLLGQALPAGSAANGQVLVSNGTSWVLGSLSTGSVTSVSGTAPISVGGTASAPIISLPAATSSTNGYLTSSDWNVFNSKQSSALSSGKIWMGNASGLASEVSLSGDATMDNAGVLTLKNTGTAGIYGSASLVPVITTDAQGRVTGVTTAAPLDATKLPLAGGTMTGTLNMGGQDITNAGNIFMAASKTLGLSSNASDPASPAAGQVWYNSTSNVIKYYDGSSVQALGVAGAGITSLNGLTSGAQTFAIGTSGNSPAFSSAASTHTLNIPLASTVGVTAGLISKTDYDNFNTKLGAVNNAAPLAVTKVWIGNASGVAQEFALSGDATMTSSGVVTVDKTQTAAASKILQLTASSVAVTKGTDIGGAGTGVAHFLYPNTATNTTLTLPSTAGSASQFLQTDGAGNLTWASPAAALPGLASTQVWVGNASGAASAVSLSGDISSITNAGVVTVNKTTTAQANKLLALDGTSVAASMGSQLNGSASGSVTLQAAAATTNYSLTFPATQGAAGQTLSNNGSGVLSWITPLISSTGFMNGGNSFGANSSLGNNDNFNLDIKTNNTSRMTILNSGNVGVGTTVPASLLHLQQADLSATVRIDNTTATAARWPGLDIRDYTSTYGGYSVVSLKTARGSSASPSATLNGDYVGMFSGYGHDGTNFQSLGGISINADENTSSTSSAGNIRFSTTTSGSTTSSEKMRITSAGNVGIGTTSPASKLDVNGSVKVGPDATTCSASIQGAIHLNGTNLEYCNGTAWTVLTSGAGSSYLSSAGGTLSGGLTISSGGLNTSGTGITNAGTISGAGNITGSSAMTVAAGGTAQNLTLSSSTTGSVNIGSGNGTQFSVLDGGASTVNYVTVKGAATNNSPVIGTAGSDANINLTLTPKGTGNTIFSSGNVGIGTAAPISVLDIETSDADNILLIRNQNSTATRNSGIRISNYGGTGFQNSASVELYNSRGTLASSSSTQSGDIIGTVIGYGRGVTGFGSSANMQFMAAENQTDTAHGGFIRFNTTTAGTTTSLERVRIDASGNVGIGTTSPSDLLHVNGGNVRIDSTHGFVISAVGEFGADSGGNMSLFNSGTPDLTFGPGGTEKMRVTHTGNVGIGTSSPGALLDVNGKINSGTRIMMQRDGSNNSFIGVQGTDGEPNTLAMGVNSNSTGTVQYITFDTSGSQRILINSSGNIGIGTSSPGELLSINGSAGGTAGGLGLGVYYSESVWPYIRGYFRHGGDAGGVNSIGGLQIVSQGSNHSTMGSGNIHLLTPTGNSADGTTEASVAARLSVLQNGNVGIGTTSPGSLLEVNGGSTAATNIRVSTSSTANGPEIRLTSNGTNGHDYHLISNQSSNSAGAGTFSITDVTAGADRFVISSDGNVGIGTTSPVAQFSLGGGYTSFQMGSSATASDNFHWVNENNYGSRGLSLYNGNLSTGIHLLRVTNAGNVGIGTLYPTYNASVNSDLNVDNANINNGTITSTLRFGSGGTANPTAPGTGTGEAIGSKRTAGGNTYGLDFYTASAARMSITNGGYVGIGTTTPSALLHLNGSALATAWNTSSDIRLKEHISEIENPLEKILNLRGVEFDWRKDIDQPTQHEQTHDIGVIAQEVEQQFPEAVTTGKDGYKSVAYPKLVSPIIGAIKTLYNHIIGVENQQANQEGQIASLKMQTYSKAEKTEVEVLKNENSNLKAEVDKAKKENAKIKARLERIEKMLKVK